MINQNDAIVELVADQGVAIAQTHGLGRQRCGHAHWGRVSEVLPDDVVFAVYFNNAGVAGIGEERVAVWQAAGEGQGIDGAPGGQNLDDFIGSGDFQAAVVALVRDQDMAVF